jgi:hypothetical protein
LKLIRIPRHIEKSLSSSSAFLDRIIATHTKSRLQSGSVLV